MSEIDYNQKFEELAEQFYRDTRQMAPGKDSKQPKPDYINELWDAWCKGRMRGLDEAEMRQKQAQSIGINPLGSVAS